MALRIFQHLTVGPEYLLWSHQTYDEFYFQTTEK